MGDLGIIIRECKSAQTENREITDAVARMIGALYHDGQASISYSFASTGAISDRTDVYLPELPSTTGRRKDHR